jgi:TatD DNase family protein
MLKLVDTHCHLNHEYYTHDIEKVIEKAFSANVHHMVCVGYDMQSSIDAVAIANQFPNIKAAVGIHPHDADQFDPENESLIRNLAAENECVAAIGETGLDYYRNFSSHEVQHDAFRRHIRMATETNLPLIVHSRDAGEDILRIISEEAFPQRGIVMHCLQDDAVFAERAIEIGCYVGLAGTITFKNAAALRDIAANIPIDRILIETDCPYLAPHPFRGKRNDPSLLPYTLQKLAEIKNISIEEAADITTCNANKFFNLKIEGCSA